MCPILPCLDYMVDQEQQDQRLRLERKRETQAIHRIYGINFNHMNIYFDVTWFSFVMFEIK